MSSPFLQASDAPAPLRSNGAPDPSRPLDALVAEPISGTAEWPGTRRGVDPRDAAVSARDLTALRFIGRAGELAQYQLHEAVFGAVSEVVVSRFVRRAAKRELIAVARWRGIGINRIRLMPRGRALLVARGVSADELFVPRAPVAEGFIEHQLWIVDALIVLARAARTPDVLLPAWALQRRFVPRPAAIPDVLASFTQPPDQLPLLLAVEIDRGSEKLASVFLPKLEKLCGMLATWAGDATAVIVLLTSSARRRDALMAASAALSLPIVVELLPRAPGRPGLAELEATFRFLR
ncbi:MAG TPA: replication-relaxation family protein [Thermoanaerobaculia bacterium]|nr:replication-relaxation family protein [Thermoanaerobaculia bacterium]